VNYVPIFVNIRRASASGSPAPTPVVLQAARRCGKLHRSPRHRTGAAAIIRPEAKAGEPHTASSGIRPWRFRSRTTTVYYGGNYLFKSTDRGDNWTRSRWGLDSARTATSYKSSVRRRTRTPLAHDGVQEYPTHPTLSESPLTPNVLGRHG